MGFILAHSDRPQSTIMLSYGKKLSRPFRYSTGQSVDTEYWDSETQRMKLRNVPDKVKTRHKSINSILDSFDRYLEQTVDKAKRLQITLSVEFLANEFDAEFHARPHVRPLPTIDFYSMIEKFIEQCRSGKRTSRSGKIISSGRIQQYVSFMEQLRIFRPELRIGDINIDFYREWIAYLNASGRALNTIGKDVKIFKAILRDTYRQDLHQNRIFEHEAFRSYDETIENVYLSDKELDKLWKLDGLKLYLMRTRDVFLVGCYTGLRISDLGVLDHHHIVEGGKMLKIIPEKTDDPVFIPVHPRVKAIIDKYGGFPKSYADQKMNEYIKELCREAGFTEQAVYKRTEGGVVNRYVEPKWQRITNHTARRSFATNLYLAGFDTLSIMKITGHKTESSFMRYICVSQRQMAEKMLAHPYFR